MDSASTSVRIYVARALRDLGDGCVALLLPVFLVASGFDAFQVGVVATLALLGSALMTIGIGVAGTRFDPRHLLLAAAALMCATGLAFAGFAAAGVVYLIAFLGTINPSAGTASIFVPLEHAVLTGAVSDRERTRSFGIYSLVGALAAALGALAAGSPGLLVQAGMTELRALQAMFVGYAVLGIVVALLYRGVPRTATGPGRPHAAPLGPSRGIVLKLALLFSVDAFAGGFIVQSLLALWLFQVHGVSLVSAANFFFAAGLLGALSQPASAWLAGRIGLVNTMVWTHIPANLALIGAALAPDLPVAIGLLLVRALLSQMDVPARSSYVMAVVTPGERTAAASFTSVPRSLASALSPALAGMLFAAGYAALPLLLAGALKIAYDVALLAAFRSLPPPEEMRT